MSIFLPKRVLAMAKKDELEQIRRLVTMTKQFSAQMDAAHQAKPNGGRSQQWRDYRKRWYAAKSELRYWRQLLRQRWAGHFDPGLYRASRASAYGRSGKYGNQGWVKIPKNALLIWVERNELGHNFFMLPNNQVVCVRGVELDGIVRADPTE